MTSAEVIKCLGLQCWVSYYRLSQECRTSESWEAVFTENKTSFRNSNKYALLDHDRSTEEYSSDFDCSTSTVVRSRKKRKSRKKRRRTYDHDDDYEDGLLDFDATSQRLGLLSNTGTWLLSTDEYSAAWSSIYLGTFIGIACLGG